MEIILILLLVINLISFFAFYSDKKKAERGEWRISETTLLLLAFCGGGLGAFLGMRIFHHKTKKMKFRILVPIFLILQIILIILGIRFLL
jgi:uncharacterized membrane protein YsdA (DUF1294 family)